MTDPENTGRLAERARQIVRQMSADEPINQEPTDPQRLAKLERAVASLRRLDREIFLANRLDAMTYAEIAERTGLSVAQVRKAMARALYEIGRYMRDQPIRRRWLWPF